MKITLKETLAVPSRTYQEHIMSNWVCDRLEELGIPYSYDEMGNVFATKGTANRYPCVAAHMDTVHEMEQITIRTNKHGHLFAINEEGEPAGIGGDDKCGVYLCLQMLQSFDAMKAAFFVSEECGCIGAKASDPKFFSDVAYCIEFDSPCDDIMSFSNDGAQLFQTKGAFYEIAKPLLVRAGVIYWQHHPYTDVSVLRRRHNFPCLNLPAGYFKAHSSSEYVVPQAVQNTLELGIKLVKALGTRKYVYVHEGVDKRTQTVPDKKIKISYLRTHEYGEKLEDYVYPTWSGGYWYGGNTGGSKASRLMGGMQGACTPVNKLAGCAPVDTEAQGKWRGYSYGGDDNGYGYEGV